MGNFMGRRPSYAYVEMTVKLWKPKGGVDVSLLESGVFIFMFNCEEDKQKVLGKWPMDYSTKTTIYEGMEPKA